MKYLIKLSSLISGGFDSSVSTYLSIEVVTLIIYFFNLGGEAHELGVKQMSYHLWSHFSLPYKKVKLEDLLEAEKSLGVRKDLESVIRYHIYNINHKFSKLERDTEYLFYCDKGVLSHLHGLYLKEK